MKDNKILISEINRIKELLGVKILTESVGSELAEFALKWAGKFIGKSTPEIDNIIERLAKPNIADDEARILVGNLVDLEPQLATTLVPKIIESMPFKTIDALTQVSTRVKSLLEQGKITIPQAEKYIDDAIGAIKNLESNAVKKELKNRFTQGFEESLEKGKTPPTPKPKVTIDDKIKIKLDKLGPSELLEFKSNLLDGLKRKTPNVEDIASLKYLETKGLINEKEFDLFMKTTPGFSETFQFLEMWRVWNSSYYTQKTFEQFVIDNGNKLPPLWKENSAKIINFIKKNTVDKLADVKWGALDVWKRVLKFSALAVMLGFAIGGGYEALYSFGEKLAHGLEAGGEKLEKLGLESESGIIGAFSDFIDYENPKINGIAIKGEGVDIDYNQYLKTEKPTISVLNKDEKIVKTSKPISVNGLLYDKFKIQISNKPIEGMEHVRPYLVTTVGEGKDVKKSEQSEMEKKVKNEVSKFLLSKPGFDPNKMGLNVIDDHTVSYSYYVDGELQSGNITKTGNQWSFGD